jgi:ubiquinol-cytochrome c reductase cytochrome b subunit
MLVLVIQIVTGIFLDDALQARRQPGVRLGRVHHARRALRAGSCATCHSTGASAFFIVVYLHMFRGMLYGIVPQAARADLDLRLRSSSWCLMAEAFMGYLLPWGQMSYWGAQVDRQPVRGHALHRARTSSLLDPRRLRGVATPRSTASSRST